MAGEAKKIRVLGLHGMGTSAGIFKTQTAAFRSKLPPNYTFDFLDAPFRTAPAPATDVFFTSDHLTWWEHPTVDHIRRAHAFLDSYLEQHGPFDILMGFSQGCSLISSYLLYHAGVTRGGPPPFKAAIFICGGVPLPALADLGIDVSQRAERLGQMTSDLLRQRTGSLAAMAGNPELIQHGVGMWDKVADLLHDPEDIPGETDVFGLDYTAMPADLRIRIPTVHVLGGKDPRWPAGWQLAYFCDKRKTYDHGGGHDIPRTSVVSATIAGMVEELASEIRGE
ncbi:serine hydrolase FSH [Chaetomium fimeti]|uniref:Serine hydrolase FSH n=1 Tax=Chaetomium fimeti TaxID=1854472 RepID=A0AAE0LR18_9PEZI|nr:serine hydrolase FSH [Chaetomium fimeti]